MQLNKLPLVTEYEMINQIKELIDKLTKYQTKVFTSI